MQQESDVDERTCVIDGCGRRRRVRGRCVAHYHELRERERPLRSAGQPVHDTELCAWWEEPCDLLAWCQDLCRSHFARAWNSKQNVPHFERSTLESLRSHHILRDVDDLAETARCSLCGPDSSFYWAGTLGKGSGRRRVCARGNRTRQRRRTTGWSDEQYDLALIAQGNRCAICGNPPEGRGRHGTLHADHCHAGMQRRALLCGQCNHVLGLVGDNAEILARAAAYLAQHAEVPRLF